TGGTRSDRRFGYFLYQPAWPNLSARRPSIAAHNVGHPHRSRGRWADELRSQYSRRLSSGRGLCGTSSQGCQASQSAGATSDQVRFGDQSSDRQGARPRSAANAAGSRRRGNRVTRREFITLLGGATAAWPLPARAQRPVEIRRIGLLMGLAEDDQATRARLAAFRQGLEKRGWSEERNVHIAYRFARASAQAQVLA